MTIRNDQVADTHTKNATRINETQFGENSLLTDEETKKYLTPFAFKIDENLFGLPLALPWRRGLALCLDLILIAILSSAPGELLAIVVAITFYKVANTRKANKKGRLKQFSRMLLRFFAAFLIFAVLLETLPELFSDETLEQVTVSTDKSLGWNEGIAIAALSTAVYQQIDSSSCQKIACWQEELLPFVEQVTTVSQDDETVQTLIETMVATIDEQHNLNKDDEQVLEHYFFEQYSAFKSELDISSQSLESPANEVTKPLAETEAIKSLAEEDTSTYKGVEWFKGIIDDLGLGFGWAAFYFSVLTSIWHGQTPGKKLFKIRVIQLDGTRLSLWDSFGRYGGYGAGLATGLLGFLQIYWDPNRQAIHDKISATVVIDVKLYEQMKKNRLDKNSV